MNNNRFTKKIDLEALGFGQPSSVQLTISEGKALRQAEDAVVASKVKVADLYVQERLVRSAIDEELKEMLVVNQAFIGIVRKIATDHGIDVDDPSKGRWSLDTETMKFTKIEDDYE